MMIAEYIRAQILDLLRWGTAAMLATMLLVVIGLLFFVMSRLVDLRKLFGGH